MMLTAKRATGRQYDFQVPSPEEEARAEKVAEGEGAEGPAGAPTATPAGQAEVGSGNLEAAYLARVKALAEGLKRAITSGTAAGNEARVRFSESQVFFRKKDFPPALAQLDVVEAQIRQALAGAGGGMGAEPRTTGTNNGDPAAQWRAKLAEWSPAIKAAMAAKGPNAAPIAKLLAQATALSKPGGDMAQALAKLTECHNLATAETRAGTAPDAEFKVRLAKCTPAIKAAMAARGPKAPDIAKLFAQATALSKPGGDMAQALAKLTECHTLATSGASVNGDPAAEWKAKLAQWSPAIKTGMAAKGPNAPAIAKLLAQATALSKPGGDMAQALAKLTECHTLAVRATSPTGEQKSGEGETATDKSPAARWQTARLALMPKLEDLVKEVIATEDPEAGKAELELKAVMRQLKAEMTTKKDATEMERYLKDDDVVASVCELAFDLKTPLLKVLADIKGQWPA
jgi:hypothetical protein